MEEVRTYWGYRKAEVQNRFLALPRLPQLEEYLLQDAGISAEMRLNNHYCLRLSEFAPYKDCYAFVCDDKIYFGLNLIEL